MHAEAGHNADLSPPDPNYEQYLALDAAGGLRTLAAIHDGGVVGFLICTVGPHLDHMSTRWGSILKAYLEPAHRRGLAGQRMFKLAETMMRREGVQLVTAAERYRQNGRGRTTRSLLDFNGYEAIETVYVKRLE